MSVTAKMFPKKFLKKKSLSGCQDLHYICAVHLLDSTGPLSLSFQVR